MKQTSNLILCILVLIVLTGCQADPESTNDTENQTTKRKPTFSFHRPKTFPEAVSKLSSIHSKLIGDDSLPEPVKYDYVEVIHGTGKSAHSHYYLASEFEEHGEDDHDDDHEGIEEKILKKVYELDFRTALRDLTRWLPDLAAMSDLEESDWNQVQSHAKELSSIISNLSNLKSDTEFRDGWKEKSEQLTTLFKDLQGVAEGLKKESK